MIKPIIFEKILFGELAPWRDENSSERKFRDILDCNLRTNKDNPKAFFKELTDNYRGNYNDLKFVNLSDNANIANRANFAKCSNLQTALKILEIPPYFNKASEFYSYLIKNECARIFFTINNYLDNPNPYLYPEYLVTSVLKSLKYIIAEVASKTHNDKFSLYVFNAMKISIFRLYEEIKIVYSAFTRSEALTEYELIFILAPDFETEKNTPGTISYIFNRFIESKQNYPVNEEQSLSFSTPADLLYCSFTYIHLNTQPEYIKDLHDSLKNYNFIHNSTQYIEFKKVLSGDQILKPVIWTGNISELSYFIKLIHNINKSVIDLKQHQWEVACKCFIMPNGSTFDRVKLKDQKKPQATASLLEKVAKQLN
jgi:hypothetical protein